VKEWGGKQTFVDMRRNYHTEDGDRYYVKWSSAEETAYPYNSIHKWENRVQAASDVFNFPEVSPEDIQTYRLHEYPGIGNLTALTILGTHDPKAEKHFAFMNGKYGPGKRIRIWVLIYKEQPRQAAKYQEALWKGGNKNEFVICISINQERDVQWAEVFSWSEDSSLKIGTRNYIESQEKLDLMKIADYLESDVLLKFKKRDFREFSYLTVEPSTKALIITYIIVLLVSVGVCFYVVLNEFKDR
jgi:hypothetical protein